MRRGLMLVLLVTLAAPAAWADDDRLYRQLGGEAGIAALVEEFIFRIGQDSRIVEHFADTNLERLRDKLEEQFCVEAGGPCTYTGDSMEEVHTGMDITEAEFNALVEALVDAMEARSLPVTAQNRLLAQLAPMRGEIIHR